MQAIYRVDGKDVVTSPNAAGPWDSSMQHGSAPAALVTWAAEAIPTPSADAGRARHHRPDASGAADPADDSKRGAARRPQDPALRGPALGRRRRRGRRDHPQDQGARAAAAGRHRGPAGRASRTRPVAARARALLLQPVRDRHLAAMPRAAGSACPVPARSGIGSTGRWSRVFRFRRPCAPWSPRISATARRRRWISASGRSSMPISPSVFRASRSGSGSWSMRNPWSVPRARALPPRGSPTSSGYFGRAVQSLVIEKR